MPHTTLRHRSTAKNAGPRPVPPLDPVLTGVTETFFADSPVPPLDPVLTGVAEPTFAPGRPQHTYADVSDPTRERAECPATDVSAGPVRRETKTDNGSVPRPRPMRAKQRTITKADALVPDSITRAPQLPTTGRRKPARHASPRPSGGAIAWQLNP